ncbi:MAG: hypothetical protein AB1425_06350 [Actinomycetota bacterium]
MPGSVKTSLPEIAESLLELRTGTPAVAEAMTKQPSAVMSLAEQSFYDYLLSVRKRSSLFGGART